MLSRFLIVSQSYNEKNKFIINKSKKLNKKKPKPTVIKQLSIAKIHIHKYMHDCFIIEYKLRI
jgi:hypothetical protein